VDSGCAEGCEFSEVFKVAAFLPEIRWTGTTSAAFFIRASVVRRESEIRSKSATKDM
jgi:hypothetical protein